MTSFRYGITVLLLIAASPAWAGNCRVDPFSAPFGSDVDAHMVVRSGKRCDIHMQMGLNYRSANLGGLQSMSIAEPAVHGTAASPDMNSWTYISKPGFVGRDRFVVEATGETMARFVRRGTSHYVVNVDVVP